MADIQIQYVRELHEACERWRVGDNKLFAAIVNSALSVLDLTERDLAVEFKTAPGTISRWANGHSRPAKPAQRAVITAISRRAKEAVG